MKSVFLKSNHANPMFHHHDDHCGCGQNHHDHHHEGTHCCGGHEQEAAGHSDHGHEHDGDASQGCGCEHHGHEHSHQEDEDDSGGEEEHHHHDSDGSQGYGCGHDHDAPHSHADETVPCETEKKVYILENLGCAHCAAKMEEKINQLPSVKDASITFATKQLRLAADDCDALLPEIRRICTSIESAVQVVPRSAKVPEGSRTKTYLVEDLGCAHCAAKMEEQIGNLPGISEASLTFATKKLKVTADDPDRHLAEIRKVCSDIESQVKVVDPSAEKKDVSAETSAARADSRQRKKKISKDKQELIGILIGAALFAASVVANNMHLNQSVVIILTVIAYVILGGKIVLEALRNIAKGQVFDENFLMSIATIGAFVIAEYLEAVGVMLFYRIGEYFEHRAVDKSRGQIMEAVDMRPEVVNLVKDGSVTVIPAEKASVGDILLIRPGDRIPLDGTITEGESRIDTSPITGEPVPVAVSEGQQITSGCVNTSGQLKIKVEKPLSESMVTRILDSVENAAASKPKIDRFITRFSRIYTPCVVIGALLVAVIPSLVTGNWNYWVYTALTFLVMSCPCALVLSVPLAFFSGIGAGSKKGILFKGGVSIEALGKLKAVVMDKTGTITEGNFQLQNVISTGSFSEDQLLSLCAGCEQNSTHPIAHSIVSAAKEKELSIPEPETLKEIAGLGIAAEMPEGKVLCGNRKLMDQYRIQVPQLPKDLYGSEVFVAINGTFAGYLIISDTLKPDAASAISRLKAMGLHTVMLTGDAQDSAEAVAKEAGIDEVHAKLLPQDKLARLADVRKREGCVMFVGDGINDAPVLAGADVGAAMGSGADAAIEAADAVFMNSSVASIPDSISIAKATGRIAMENVVFALIVKAVVMALGLIGFANMWAAVFADTGVAMLCVLNSIRVLYKK